MAANKVKKGTPAWKKANAARKECTAAVDNALKRCLKSSSGAIYTAMGAATFVTALTILF